MPDTFTLDEAYAPPSSKPTTFSLDDAYSAPDHPAVADFKARIAKAVSPPQPASMEDFLRAPDAAPAHQSAIPSPTLPVQKTPGDMVGPLQSRPEDDIGLLVRDPVEYSRRTWDVKSGVAPIDQLQQVRDYRARIIQQGELEKHPKALLHGEGNVPTEPSTGQRAWVKIYGKVADTALAIPGAVAAKAAGGTYTPPGAETEAMLPPAADLSQAKWDAISGIIGDAASVVVPSLQSVFAGKLAKPFAGYVGNAAAKYLGPKTAAKVASYVAQPGGFIALFQAGNEAARVIAGQESVSGAVKSSVAAPLNLLKDAALAVPRVTDAFNDGVTRASIEKAGRAASPLIVLGAMHIGSKMMASQAGEPAAGASPPPAANVEPPRIYSAAELADPSNADAFVKAYPEQAKTLSAKPNISRSAFSALFDMPKDSIDAGGREARAKASAAVNDALTRASTTAAVRQKLAQGDSQGVRDVLRQADIASGKIPAPSPTASPTPPPEPIYPLVPAERIRRLGARVATQGFNRDALDAKIRKLGSQQSFKESGLYSTNSVTDQYARALASRLPVAPNPITEPAPAPGPSAASSTEQSNGQIEGQGETPQGQGQAGLLSQTAPPEPAAQPATAAPPEISQLSPPRGDTKNQTASAGGDLSSRIKKEGGKWVAYNAAGEKYGAPFTDFKDKAQGVKLIERIEGQLGASGSAVEPDAATDSSVNASGRGSLRDTAASWESSALETIKSKGATVRSGLDPELLAAYVKYGAAQVLKGTAAIGDFTKHFIDRFGEEVAPHIGGIYQESKRLADSVSGTLANPLKSPEGRAMLDAQTAARAKAGTPEERHDVTVQSEANQRLQSGYDSEKARLFDSAKAGGQFNDTDTVVAQAILDRESPKAFQKGGDIRAIVDLHNTYRESGTTQARAFRQRQNLSETPQQRNQRIVYEAVVGSVPEKATPRQKEKAVEIAAKTRDDLLREGIDLSKPETFIHSPERAMKAVRIARTNGAKISDMLYEYYLNAIFSGPQTQIVNIAGTAGHAAWNMLVEHPIAAAINLGIRDPSAAKFSDFKYMARGILPGIARGMKNAALAWKTEVPWLEESLGREGTNRFEGPRTSIPGRLGRFVRAMGTRPLGAADDFTKSIIAQMQVGSHANKIARAEGLTGKELSDRISSLVENTHSEAWNRALKDAKHLAFQDKPGKVAQAVMGLRKIPGVRYIIPTIMTPANIFKLGLRKSPLGAANLAYRTMQAIQSGDWSKIPQLGAEQVVANGLMLALWAYANSDDPKITGSSQRAGGKRDLQYRVAPPMSVKIGDHWINYGRAGEPFATAMSLLVDGVYAVKSGKGAVSVTSEQADNIIRQVRDKTFLSGVADLMDVMDTPGSVSEKALDWTARFATSWVPNNVKQVSRALSTTIPQRDMGGAKETRLARLAKRTLQRTELGITPDTPMVDAWGDEVKSSTSPIAGTDIPYRMIVPAKEQAARRFAADRALLVWNNHHSDDGKGWLPQSPDRAYKVDGETRWMDDPQYHDFLVLGGRIAKELLTDAIRDPANPTEGDIDEIKASMREAHQTAESLLKDTWAGGASPPDPAAVADFLHQKTVARHVEAASAPRPKLAAQRAAWVERSTRSAEWLSERGIDPGEAWQAFQQFHAHATRPTPSGDYEKNSDKLSQTILSQRHTALRRKLSSL